MTIEKKNVESQHGLITLYTLTNSTGARVTLSSLGAGIVSVEVPDSNGKLANVALGYANPADYMADGPCAGKVPGRYANRIAKGQLRVDGRNYQLAINNGPNALHGGPTGFQNRIWNSRVTDDGKSVEFYRTSPDGEENYPGNLEVSATYTWTDNNELRLDLRATTDAPTVVNLTNHCYWNLDGENSGSVLDHKLRLAASRYLPTDSTLIPTGEMAPVVNTPMDFTEAKAIGRDIKEPFAALEYGKGYDNCWVIDQYKDGELLTAAVLEAPTSGRVLEVATTQPAVQVYTGNWLAGCPENPEGRSYNDYDGVAIECQGMPDAPHHPDFPSQQLYPGQDYHKIIEFKFSTK
ncbi:MAG: galactose mutarotase [Firmicutes bacterium]|nr:galactose mutarotase [Bacillota bacterium]MCM1400445.1 galactose mutarotase [Bacteroides sp.]MCM1476915.1 galactose mutarotase [Bacteroides sp.]